MRAATPEAWGNDLSAPPILNSDGFGRRSGLLRRWRGTRAHMSQPPLDHHYVVLHLGGAKRVTRTGDGRTRVADVEEGALTIVPAGERYEWSTVGPIDFAHLYIHPARLNHAIAIMFDRDAAAVTLSDDVGVTDPLLSHTIQAMLAEVERGAVTGGPYLDALFDVVLANLVCRHSSAGEVTQPARHALAPVRLRRVLDFVEAEIARPIGLHDLARVAGLSRFHFSRAFHNAMGEPPLAYVGRKRLETAKRLLRATEEPVAEVGRRAGFKSASHFAGCFRRHAGMAPSQFRRQL